MCCASWYRRPRVLVLCPLSDQCLFYAVFSHPSFFCSFLFFLLIFPSLEITLTLSDLTPFAGKMSQNNARFDCLLLANNTIGSLEVSTAFLVLRICLNLSLKHHELTIFLFNYQLQVLQLFFGRCERHLYSWFMIRNHADGQPAFHFSCCQDWSHFPSTHM